MHALARLLGAHPGELTDIAERMGFRGVTHMSAIEPEVVAALTAAWQAGEGRRVIRKGDIGRLSESAADVRSAQRAGIPVRAEEDYLDRAQIKTVSGRRQPSGVAEFGVEQPSDDSWRRELPTMPKWGSPEAEVMEFLGDAVLGAYAALQIARGLPWSIQLPDQVADAASARTTNAALVAAANQLGIVDELGMPRSGKRCADAVEAVVGVLWANGKHDDAARLSHLLCGSPMQPSVRQNEWLWPGEDLKSSKPENRRNTPSVVKAAEIASGHLFSDWSLASYCLKGGGGAPHRRLRYIGATHIKLFLAVDASQREFLTPGIMDAAVSARSQRAWLSECQRNNRWLDSRLPTDIFADAAQALVGAVAWETGVRRGATAAGVIVSQRSERDRRIEWKQRTASRTCSTGRN